MTLLRVEGLRHRREERATGRCFDALRVDALDVAEGEVVAVIGANGSGKSTLLECLSFMQRPTEGRVLFKGADPWESGYVTDARRDCPILLQHTRLFTGSVWRNVAAGLRFRGIGRGEALARAREALESVGMGGRVQRRSTELSVGEQRRVGLAQLLVLNTPVLILDEPVANLDEESTDIIEDLVRTRNREAGTTVILASHNLAWASRVATRVLTLTKGVLVADGSGLPV